MDEDLVLLQIYDFLQDKDYTPTIEISRAVFGKGATKKMVNKHLYTLLKENKVVKRCEDDGTKPCWKILEEE